MRLAKLLLLLRLPMEGCGYDPGIRISLGIRRHHRWQQVKRRKHYLADVNRVSFTYNSGTAETIDCRTGGMVLGAAQKYSEEAYAQNSGVAF